MHAVRIALGLLILLAAAIADAGAADDPAKLLKLADEKEAQARVAMEKVHELQAEVRSAVDQVLVQRSKVTLKEGYEKLMSRLAARGKLSDFERLTGDPAREREFLTKYLSAYAKNKAPQDLEGIQRLLTGDYRAVIRTPLSTLQGDLRAAEEVARRANQEQTRQLRLVSQLEQEARELRARAGQEPKPRKPGSKPTTPSSGPTGPPTLEKAASAIWNFNVDGNPAKISIGVDPATGKWRGDIDSGGARTGVKPELVNDPKRPGEKMLVIKTFVVSGVDFLPVTLEGRLGVDGKMQWAAAGKRVTYTRTDF